jgi:hypothetical protein
VCLQGYSSADEVMSLRGDGLMAIAGGLSTSSGGISVASGGVNIISGGLRAGSGGITVSSGGLNVVAGGLSVAGSAGNGVIVSSPDLNFIFVFGVFSFFFIKSP